MTVRFCDFERQLIKAWQAALCSVILLTMLGTPTARGAVFLGDEIHFSPDVGQRLFPAGNLNVFKQFVLGFKEGISVGDTVEIDLLFTTLEFGGSLDASFGANFGLEFGLCLGGNADFDMGFQPMVVMPDNYPSEIPLPITVNENMLRGSHFTTTFPPLGKIYADLILHLEADVNAEACVFSCFDPLSFLDFPLSTCDFPALPSGDKLFNLSTRCDPSQLSGNLKRNSNQNLSTKNKKIVVQKSVAPHVDWATLSSNMPIPTHQPNHMKHLRGTLLMNSEF